MPVTTPLFLKVDCLSLPVKDLEAALAFYRDKLGHDLIWRTKGGAGLRMRDGPAELALLDSTKGLLRTNACGNVID